MAKRCIKCFEERDEGEFQLRPDTGKRRNVCQPCRKPKLLAAQRRWYAQNAVEQRQRSRDYVAAHPEKARERYALNPDADLAKSHRYRARRLNSQVEDTTEYRMVIRYDPCAYCGTFASEVDHITPLISGGYESSDNLTASCRSCNASKGTQPLLLFLGARNG